MKIEIPKLKRGRVWGGGPNAVPYQGPENIARAMPFLELCADGKCSQKQARRAIDIIWWLQRYAQFATPPGSRNEYLVNAILSYAPAGRPPSKYGGKQYGGQSATGGAQTAAGSSGGY